MKTTFELPDRVFREAKMTAAARKQSMRQFFTDAISDNLKSRDSGTYTIVYLLTVSAEKREASSIWQERMMRNRPFLNS